ncbi:MAG: hypothetical protein MJ231_06320 [bacterium]|nr:hypothetical protein [bacterium]
MDNKKYLMYTAVTFLLMTFLVVGAYNMSSKTKVNTNTIEEEQVEQAESTAAENNDEESESISEESNKDEITKSQRNEEIDIPAPPTEKKQFDNKISELQPISDENVSKNPDINNKLAEAVNAKHNADYSKAIECYNSLLEAESGNSSIKAICYEGLAEVYAKQKRYGTAIINAQKAYSSEPTSTRRFLLAKIYYKAGETEKAKTLTNMALEGDF